MQLDGIPIERNALPGRILAIGSKAGATPLAALIAGGEAEQFGKDEVAVPRTARPAR